MADDKPKEMSPSDKTKLARLVERYGRDLVTATVDQIPKLRRKRRPGRPRSGDKWEHVEWIECRAGDLGGGYGAIKQATVERFLMVTPREKHNNAAEVGKFEKYIKNARDEWSKTERAIKAARRDARARGLMWRPKRPRT
jgi:hypothetical protein